MMLSIEKQNSVYTIKLFGIKIKINSKKNYFLKPFCYTFSGQNNKILIKEENGTLKENPRKISGLNISIHGNNNTIIIDRKTLKSFTNSQIKIHSDNTYLNFEETNRINGLIVTTCCGNNQKLYWGKNSNCWGVDVFLHEENASLIIGEDCMFSGLIRIWATDGHCIYNNESKQILNKLKSETKIGNHVWIGQNVTLLKSADIKDNSVIGACSVVASNFTKPNVVIGGNPAKVIKENTNWDRDTAERFEKKQALKQSQ